MIDTKVIESETATLKEILQYVVGFSAGLSEQMLKSSNIEIDGQSYSGCDTMATISVGTVINVVGQTRVNVIGAHLRTLSFYRR